MPDLDYLPRKLRPTWRPVANAIQGRWQPYIIADAIEKSLAATLRQLGDLNWLKDIFMAVEACREQGSLLPLEVAEKELDPLLGLSRGFFDVALSMSASEDTSNEVVEIKDFVTRGLKRMLEKLCIGQLEPDMVPAVFPSTSSFQEYMDTSIAFTRLSELAIQIIRFDDTTKIRAPRTLIQKRETKDLIYEPII